MGAGLEWELRSIEWGSMQGRSVKGQGLSLGLRRGPLAVIKGGQGPVCLGPAGPLGRQVCNNSSHFLPY